MTAPTAEAINAKNTTNHTTTQPTLAPETSAAPIAGVYVAVVVLVVLGVLIVPAVVLHCHKKQRTLGPKPSNDRNLRAVQQSDSLSKLHCSRPWLCILVPTWDVWYA